MAFVREDVTGKDKDLFNSFGLTYDGKPRIASTSTMWTVDKKRDIYFIKLGGGALERPTVYAVIWQGEKVIINVEIRSARWLIGSIKVSIKLEQKNEELIKIIKEVVPISYGCEVIFEIFPDPIFVEEERLRS